jgi:hypothetical protein
VLELEPGAKHDGEGLGLKFHCRFAHAKIETKCPPNQIFKSSDFVQANPPVAEEEEVSASDDDDASSDDEPLDGDADDDERPVWETKQDGSLKFCDDMPLCYRLLAEAASLERPPSMLHTGDPSVQEAEWFGDYFFPTEWWKHDVVPAWSEAETNVWRGLWRWMDVP